MVQQKKQQDNFYALASIFILTTGLLTVVRIYTPLDILLVDRFFPGWGWMQIFILGVYSVWIGRILLRKSRTASKVRSRIWALFSFVFFAQFALGLIGIDKFLMTGDLHIPVPALIAAGPVYRGGHGLFMPILFGVSLLLAGPAWCSWLCYIGAWDDQSSRILKKKPLILPVWAIYGIRPGLLILVIGAAFLMNKAGVSGYYAAIVAIGFGLAGVMVMVYFSRRTGAMAHCSVFCPIGLIANVFGRINPWRIRIKKGCTQCGICAGHCRYSALALNNIVKGKPGLSCTLCGDCVNICPESVMEYRLPLISPASARAAFIVLTTSLHSVFLATARI